MKGDGNSSEERESNLRHKNGSEKNNVLEDQSLQDSMMLVVKHQNYLKFWDGCRMLTMERKKGIVGEIENIFDIVSKSSFKRNRLSDDSINDNSVS